MRNFIGNLLRLSTVCIAIVGFFAPMNVRATSENILINGNFSANGGGWTGANGGAGCSGGSPSLGLWAASQLTFSYVQNSVTQQVIVPSPSNLELSFLASSEWGGTYSATLSDSNESDTTGVLTAGVIQASTLQITTTEQNELVTVTFSGVDSLFWAGCYGPVIKNASLIATTTELSMFAKVWENQILTLEAPEGSVFTGITFMSYGTPTGENENYAVNQSCHATLSGEQQAQFLGQNTLVIGANNSVFGDPCPGTGKWLSVTATYSAPTPTTTTTTTTIPQGSYSGGGCGPYSPIYVTGTINGGGWGSGPFTDDSNFGAAAVFAGLIEPGQSAWLEPYDVNNYPSYIGGTSNGVTMSNWNSEWCGFNIKIFGTSTPTTTTTTTTTLPKFLGQPANLTTLLTEDGLLISWEAADDNVGVSPERYAVSWSNGTSGWGVATGNVGDQTALNTSIILNYSLFQSTGGLDVEYTISVRADNDTFGVYSQTASVAEVLISMPTVPTTTGPTTTEPPTTEPETTTTTEPEIVEPPVTEPETTPPVVIPPDTDPPTTEPEIVEPEPNTPEDTQPEETVPEDIQNQVDEILSGDLTEEEFANAVDEILTSADSEEELVAAATELLSGDLSEEQFTEVIDQVFAEELSDEAFAEVLDTVFEEPLSDEEFTAVIDAVLDQPLSDEQFENLVDALSSDTVTDEQVQEAVDAIIENGITEEQATEIATSAEVLSSIDGEQAAEIFAEIPIEEITEEQALEIIAAVQDAPTEVRSSFEEEINICGSGSLNTYVPLGSNINVGQRRAVIAAGAVIAVAPVAGASRRR